ncbi:hypothetical protein ONZ45_g2702 [Pleurotus djamor]|nr:hypothetical protein ONZ45_g2702 [Pleurotus djamor]
MDVFMLSLFSADLVQALGAIMDVKWIQDGKVEIGSFCSAQGVIQQLGETGVAITTLIIAIYSFIGIWWRLGTGPRRTLIAKAVITAVWLFVVFIVIIPNLIHRDKHQLYQAPTPYWCWIGGEFNGLRIAGEYIWLWLTLIFSLIAYVPLFLWKLGYISPREDTWWKVTFHPSREVDSTARGRDSFAMIAYPLVYSILVLPLSIVRWNAFSQESRDAGAETPSAATLSVISIYGFSGAFNVLLLFVTRPASRLFGRTQHEGLHTPKGSDGTLRDSEDLGRPHHSPTLPMNSLTGRPLGRLPSLDSE